MTEHEKFLKFILSNMRTFGTLGEWEKWVDRFVDVGRNHLDPETRKHILERDVPLHRKAIECARRIQGSQGATKKIRGSDTVLVYGAPFYDQFDEGDET